MPGINRIFLIGMPGAGKSYWARAWSEQHSWSFVDLDDQIETFANASIPQIFASVGEDGFRSIESHVLSETIRGTGSIKTIIATGGGTPLFSTNLQEILTSGCVVFLKARIKTLKSHLLSSPAERPLLVKLSEDNLYAMADERLPFYSQAHHQIEVENITPSTFAQILEACTNRHS
jgi:shikimate kinase